MRTFVLIFTTDQIKCKLCEKECCFLFFFLIVFVCIILFRTTCNNCNGRTHRTKSKFLLKKKKKKVQFNLDNDIRQIYCIEIKLKLLFNISRNVKINNIINLLSNYKKNHDSSIIAKKSNAEVKG